MGPITLEGKFVRLEPLADRHREGLCDAVRDGALWKLHVTAVPHPDEMEGFLDRAREMLGAGSGLAFATVDKATGRVAGSTRFMNASADDKRVEIGYTFLGKTHQRTRINTETKLLMLTHAFETLGWYRVELITDYLNTRSRQAILRLGAKEEGLLRSHMIMRDGRVRDSVLFSIIKSEWPGIKTHLTMLLAR